MTVYAARKDIIVYFIDTLTARQSPCVTAR